MSIRKGRSSGSRPSDYETHALEHGDCSIGATAEQDVGFHELAGGPFDLSSAVESFASIKDAIEETVAVHSYGILRPEGTILHILHNVPSSYDENLRTNCTKRVRV